MTIKGKLKPDALSIKDLIDETRKGSIKIPDFQRRFVWKSKQALQLLDSIYKNYPIGSLLLWRTLDKMPTAQRNIGDFALPETSDLQPTDYVLDGQQRLTVIYSCLGAPHDATGFAAAYDLEAQQFIEAPKPQSNHGQMALWPTLHIYPLRSIFSPNSMRELIAFNTALGAHPDGQKLQNRLTDLVDVFQSYKIPIITLTNLTVEEVCPIFERINSTGTRLSIYDLVVAATWSPSFNLGRETTRLADSLEPKGFGDVDGDTIVKCLAAMQYKSTNREDILKLRAVKSGMRSLVSKTEVALLRAVDFLNTEFGVYSRDFVPYEAIIVILTSLLAETKELTTEQVSRVREWFWRAAFSERYRGAADTFISRDIRDVKDFVFNGIGEGDSLGEPPSAHIFRESDFSGDNARSRAFALALATKSPHNLVNGAVIDTADALSVFNKKQFHHIYPKAHLKRIQTTEYADALTNICILSASSNRTISDENPNFYMPRIIERLGDRAESVFESNMLPRPKEVDYSTMTYTEFMERRIDILLRDIGVLCLGGHI